MVFVSLRRDVWSKKQSKEMDFLREGEESQDVEKEDSDGDRGLS